MIMRDADGERVYLDASALTLGEIRKVTCPRCQEVVTFITGVSAYPPFIPEEHCIVCSKEK